MSRPDRKQKVTRTTSVARTRQRAPQGDGRRLRGEIIDAALQLLVASGNPDHVTLRAVARAVGIAAPSIYLHFADRAALLDAVMLEAESRFAAALKASDPGSDAAPAMRLRALGLAYVDFAAQQRGAYGVLFNGLLPATTEQPIFRSANEAPRSFAVLYEMCVHAHDVAADGGDPMRLALRLWAGIHGYVTLLVNAPSFPWPDAEHFVNDTMLPVIPTARSRVRRSRP
jgi:AcrR family transcriptional regulator